jgi:hypothetical protein
VVPDGVVFGVLLEEGGDLLESGVREVAGFDLGWEVSARGGGGAGGKGGGMRCGI